MSDPHPRLPDFFYTPLGKHTLLVVAMLLVVSFTSWSAHKSAHAKARCWLNLYNGVETTKPDGFFDNLFDDACDEPKLATTQAGSANANAPDSNRAGNVNADSNAAANSNTGNANIANAGDASQSQGDTQATPTPTPTTPSTPTPTPTPCPPVSAEQDRVLGEQTRIVRSLVRHHGEVMESFFENYYKAIAVVMLTGILAAVALLHIMQKGWELANPYAKTVFVVMTAATAYYGLFPTVFKQEENIKDNKALFLEYKTLENELMSYRATCGNLKGEAADPKQFITYINFEIDRLSNIAIGFDYTKINYKGIFDTNPKPSPSPAPTIKPTP